MTDQPTPPPTAHAAVTRGLERALRDLGVDLVGCPPSVLSGHVLKELREDGLLRTQSEESGVNRPFDDVEVGADALHAAMCPCGWGVVGCRRHEPSQLREWADAVLSAARGTS